jgi:hypothetical protein
MNHLNASKRGFGPSPTERRESPRDLLRNVFGWSEAAPTDDFLSVCATIVAFWLRNPAAPEGLQAEAARALSTAGALARFGEVLEKADGTGPHAGKHADRRDRHRADARAMMDRDFRDGLQLRLGKHLAPQAVVQLYPQDGGDLVAFAMMRDWRRAVSQETLPCPASTLAALSPADRSKVTTRRVLQHQSEAARPRFEQEGDALTAMQAWEMPSGLAVCGGCTIVFEPRRKAHSKYCARCEKRPPARASFLTHPPVRGETVPLRVPELEAGKWLEGLQRWRTIHVACCVECAGYFTAARRDARVCGDVCAARHARRAACEL